MNATRYPWRSLLLTMSTAFDFPLLIGWNMTNGAEFQMLLPKHNEFCDDSLASHLQFPFTYDEIDRISIENSIPQFTPPHDIDIRLTEILQQHTAFELLDIDGVTSIRVKK